MNNENKPNNEDIIREITRDLEDTYVDCKETQDDCEQQQQSGNKEDKFYDACSNHRDNDEEEEVITDDNDNNKLRRRPRNEAAAGPQKPKYEEDSEEYRIDEVTLNERDDKLDDEQREKFKTEANQLKNKGNEAFRDGDNVTATSSYTEGLRICPLIYVKERAILYANRAAARAILEPNAKCMAIQDCTKAVELDPNYVKAYLRRAHLYEQEEKLDESMEDYKKVLTFDPKHSESRMAVMRLEPKIHERNEKLKEEMMGKLKDLGNMILKPFGLSTNNFQMDKNAEGGYSVQFKQNPT